MCEHSPGFSCGPCAEQYHWPPQPAIDPFDFTPRTEGATMTDPGDFPCCAPAVPPSSADQGSPRTDGPDESPEPQKGTQWPDWEAERLRRWLP